MHVYKEPGLVSEVPNKKKEALQLKGRLMSHQSLWRGPKCYQPEYIHHWTLTFDLEHVSYVAQSRNQNASKVTDVENPAKI